MKRFLETPEARRIASMTLVAFVVGLLAPVSHGRAAAQTTAARTAYLVPFTAAQGIDAEIPQRVTADLADTIRKYRTDPRVKQPIELVNLNPRNPVIERAIKEGTITADALAQPPTDKDAAIQFARQLGLSTVLVGTVDTYKESDDKTTATVETTVLEYRVPAQADAPATVAASYNKTTQIKATDELGKARLRMDVTDRISLILASSLMGTPEIAPVEPTSPTKAVKKGGGPNPAFILLAVVGVAAGIFLLSTLGSKSKSGAGNLNVTNVRAQAQNNAVRVTWDPVAGAIGYNVYRRVAGSQPIRSHRRGRQTNNASSFELLVNPDTNTTPTVVGSGRTSFIDTTAVSGTIYQYAVAAVNSANAVGQLSDSTTQSQAGPNIGTAPTLTASSGNGFISLSWTASDTFVTSYIIFRRQGGAPDTSKNSPDQLAQVTGQTTYDDRTVANGVSYTYIVQPETPVNVNGLLSGQDSNPVTVAAAQGAAPQAPRNVVATVDSTGRAVITWNANPETNIDFYEVLQRKDRSAHRAVTSGTAPWLRNLPQGAQRADVGQRSDPRLSRQIDLTNFQLIGTSPASVTNFTIGPLPDGTYTFAIRAVNKSGQRGPATAAAAVTVNAPLSPPAGVQAIGLANAVRVTWQPVAGDVASYHVYRSQTPITAGMTGPATAPGIARVATISGNTLVFDDSNLPNNSAFYYAVTSVDTAGAESLFGKGTTPDTGVIAYPHATPATMTLAVDKQNLSGNGQAIATCTVTVKDSTGAVTAGVTVNLTASAGTFVNLPANATQLDTLGRQVRALTDLNGQVVIGLRSSVVTTQGQQLSVNIQAQAPELPAAQQLQSQAISFLASLPTVIIVSPDQNQLTADQASTTNVTAKVLDALGQPVPDNLFHVDFLLNSTNGQIRAAGNVQNNPFLPGPQKVTVVVVSGQAVAVYQAGNNASPQGAPPQNIVPIQASVTENAAVASQTIITLVPGAPARVDFGLTSITVPKGQSQTVTATVRDAQGNPVRSGQVVNLAVQPTGVVTVAQSATTDNNGQISLQITAGPDAGGAVIQATIPNTQVQSQLAVTVS